MNTIQCKLRPIFTIWLLGLILTSASLFADENQNSDQNNSLYTGKVAWVDIGTKHYPKHIEARNIYDPTAVFFAEVDDNGEYEISLVPGNYVIAPTINFHWQRNWRQAFIRIDDQRSRISVNTQSLASENLPILSLLALSAPENLQIERGLRPFNRMSAKALDDYIHAMRDYYQFPGASIALFDKNGIFYQQNYGVVNSISQQAVNKQTVFEMGSITKFVYSYVVMRLAERGDIDLDAPLYQTLELDAIKHDESRKLMTARHVLLHQTGLPNWLNDSQKERFDLRFAPGTDFNYSGEGFEYLKRVVETITGESTQAIIQRELIEPFGLNQFYFASTEESARIATDGVHNGVPAKMRHISQPMTAYSLVTNATELSNFYIQVIQRNGMSKETFAEWMQPEVRANENQQRGLGMIIGEDDLGTYFGHGGVTRDFVSNSRYYPDADFGFVFVSNSLTSGWLTVDELPIALARSLTGMRETAVP